MRHLQKLIMALEKVINLKKRKEKQKRKKRKNREE
jgi:hypothetical protein